MIKTETTSICGMCAGVLHSYSHLKRTFSLHLLRKKKKKQFSRQLSIFCSVLCPIFMLICTVCFVNYRRQVPYKFRNLYPILLCTSIIALLAKLYFQKKSRSYEYFLKYLLSSFYHRNLWFVYLPYSYNMHGFMFVLLIWLINLTLSSL